jgi:hypothetical protein
MKEFKLTPDMLTLNGAFYPRGYAFLMFAGAAAAEEVARAVDKDIESEAMLLDPDTILREIGKADGESDLSMPSVGTEGATVMNYVKLARQGHHALMVQVPSDEHAERLMVAARKAGFSYGQRYHLLVIEDME